MSTDTTGIVELDKPETDPGDLSGRFLFIKRGSGLCQVINIHPDSLVATVRLVCDGWGEALDITNQRFLFPDEYLTVAQMRSEPDSILTSYDDILNNMREFLLSRLRISGKSVLSTISVVQDLLPLCALTGNDVPRSMNINGSEYLIQTVIGTWLDGLHGTERQDVLGRFTETSSVRPIFDRFEEWGFASRLKEEMIGTADSIFFRHSKNVVIY